MFRRRLLFSSRRDKEAISSVTFGLFSNGSQKDMTFSSTANATANATSAHPHISLPPNSNDQCQESQEGSVISSSKLTNNHYERRPAKTHSKRFGLGCPSASTQVWRSVLNFLRTVLKIFNQARHWLLSRRRMLFAIVVCLVVAISVVSAVEVPSNARDNGVEHILMLLSASILPQGDRFVCENKFTLRARS